MWQKQKEKTQREQMPLHRGRKWPAFGPHHESNTKPDRRGRGDQQIIRMIIKKRHSQHHKVTLSFPLFISLHFVSSTTKSVAVCARFHVLVSCRLQALFGAHCHQPLGTFLHFDIVQIHILGLPVTVRPSAGSLRQTMAVFKHCRECGEQKTFKSSTHKIEPHGSLGPSVFIKHFAVNIGH
jgi:hypothetical protein